MNKFNTQYNLIMEDLNPRLFEEGILDIFKKKEKSKPKFGKDVGINTPEDFIKRIKSSTNIEWLQNTFNRIKNNREKALKMSFIAGDKQGLNAILDAIELRTAELSGIEEYEKGKETAATRKFDQEQKDKKD